MTQHRFLLALSFCTVFTVAACGGAVSETESPSTLPDAGPEDTWALDSTASDSAPDSGRQPTEASTADAASACTDLDALGEVVPRLSVTELPQPKPYTPPPPEGVYELTEASVQASSQMTSVEPVAATLRIEARYWKRTQRLGDTSTTVDVAALALTAPFPDHPFLPVCGAWPDQSSGTRFHVDTVGFEMYSHDSSGRHYERFVRRR